MKGPSVTVTFPTESRTRAPSSVGASPPLPSIVPALVSSSASFAIASISCLGGGPCFSACLTIIMNLIAKSPLGFGLGEHPDDLDQATRALLISRSRNHGFDRFAAFFWMGANDQLDIVIRCPLCLLD